MSLKIALAGNPNCGKTTLFNALTGSNQFVGNWPGVTVEKKEGKLKKHKDVIIMDLPGIYSLSPYTMEEVVARNYLVDERPDGILNIVDGTNLERNLYLTTQLIELGIPMVVAVNMMDIVRKNGDRIDMKELSRRIGCSVVDISALKEEGIIDAAEAAIKAAEEKKPIPLHSFSGPVEHALAHIEEAVFHDLPEEQQRWFAVKLFERDKKVIEKLKIDKKKLEHIEKDIKRAEEEMDDDAESIITNERYLFIESVTKVCYKRHRTTNMSTSDKIDKIVTNRWAGLPIFAAIMFLVYFISMQTVGVGFTDWANDGLFGDGFHLVGIGSAEAQEAAKKYGDTDAILAGAIKKYGSDAIADAVDTKNKNYSEENAKKAIDQLDKLIPANASFEYSIEDEDTLKITTEKGNKKIYDDAAKQYLDTEYKGAYGAPDPAGYGVWVPGVPVLAENLMDSVNAADWLKRLIIDGIIAGVGSVLSFVPQIFVLFFLLAILESCGYMSRIAFVLDRIFRHFGLSGKSFIPMLIASGCGVPGIMASRTIENPNDRRMTVITATFIPCSAKLPFIAMIAGALFGGSALVATSAYFIGIAAVIISGVMLKKTRFFAGEDTPFVMELPAYHMPLIKNVLRSMWDRGWSFIKKAGTVILISTVVVWFTSFFGIVDGAFTMLEEDQLDHSFLAMIGSGIAWLFAPLGWGTWQTAVASLTGLIAKENIVSTMGILYGADGNVYASLGTVFTGISGFSFLIFNLLCAPCVAAMSAIKREMNSAKWTSFAIGYQCVFAYAVSLMINQFGTLLSGAFEPSAINIISLVLAFLFLAFGVYMLFFKKHYECKTIKAVNAK